MSNVVKIPGTDQAFVVLGSEKAADTIRSVIEQRQAFNESYMASRGWGTRVEDLTIDQILEIRSQPGWKNVRGQA